MVILKCYQCLQVYLECHVATGVVWVKQRQKFKSRLYVVGGCGSSRGRGCVGGRITSSSYILCVRSTVASLLKWSRWGLPCFWITSSRLCSAMWYTPSAVLKMQFFCRPSSVNRVGGVWLTCNCWWGHEIGCRERGLLNVLMDALPSSSVYNLGMLWHFTS